MNTTDLTPLVERPYLDFYRKQAKELLKAARAGDQEAIVRMRRSHPHPSRFNPVADEDVRVTLLADAQVVLARENGFESWPKFRRFVEEVIKANTPVSDFERAADAIVNGDSALLRRLLGANPGLIKARSPRVHRCMLLHYVGSNGFENYRQKTPPNALEILNILLDAGAEVDAPAETYGRGTTLGLVATSVHPVIAGVQLELLQRLIDAGADVNGGPGSWNVVNACLANGRGVAARFLADRGARLNLESAAGVGRLELVEGFLSAGVDLQSKDMVSGFMWACEYGHDEVVAFLVEKGVDLSASGWGGMTPLHWAVIGGQAGTAKLLLAHGAALEAENAFGGTALGQALWSAEDDKTGLDFRPVVRVLVEAGARTDLSREMSERVLALLRDA